MQRIFISIFIISFLFSCKQSTKKEFEVNGAIKNSKDKIVYLQETPLGSGERIISDSSVINNDGSFHLKAKTAEESLFNLSLKNETYPIAFIVNDVSKITVNVDINNQGDYKVKGSPASKSLKDFSVAANNKWMSLYVLGREMDSLNSKGTALLGEMQNYVKGYIENSPGPITSVWALGTYSQVFSMSDYQTILNGIVRKFPNHKGIAAIKEMNDRQVALAKQKFQPPRETEWTGKQAPELSLPDMNGNEIKLSSFKGKYVLVDFWASWCLPCRQENPNVVQAYNKYKNKNFTILGISLDKEKDDWLNAIRKDKLSWAQVSDLQEWNSLAVSTFNFTGIPFNVLVDPDGKIIAQSLRGNELEQKLEEVLK